MVWQDHLRRAAVADRQGKGSVGEKSTRYGEDDEHVAKWIVGGDDDGDGERKNDWVGNMKMSLQDARNLAWARFGLGKSARSVTCYLTTNP